MNVNIIYFIAGYIIIGLLFITVDILIDCMKGRIVDFEDVKFRLSDLFPRRVIVWPIILYTLYACAVILGAMMLVDLISFIKRQIAIFSGKTHCLCQC